MQETQSNQRPKQTWPEGTEECQLCFLHLVGGSRWNFNGWTNSYPPRMLWQSPRSWIKKCCYFQPCRIRSFGLTPTSTSAPGGWWRLVALLSAPGSVQLQKPKVTKPSGVTEYEVQCSENASRTPVLRPSQLPLLMPDSRNLDLPCWQQQKEYPPSFPCRSPCFSQPELCLSVFLPVYSSG